MTKKKAPKLREDMAETAVACSWSQSANYRRHFRPTSEQRRTPMPCGVAGGAGVSAGAFERSSLIRSVGAK